MIVCERCHGCGWDNPAQAVEVCPACGGSGGVPKLTMTFTVQEWRWIAAACLAVKSSSLIDGKTIKPLLTQIAHDIARETGK